MKTLLRSTAGPVAKAAAIAALVVSSLVSTSASAAAGAPSAAGVQPIEKSGNPTCATLLPGVTGMKEFKINSPTTTTVPASDGSLSVSITTRNTGAGPVLDWDLGGGGGTIQGIFVKGGPGGNLYKYALGEPPVLVSHDEGLHSPINPSNGKYYGLSHISFCYVPGTARIDVTKSCTKQTINKSVVTYDNTVTIRNTGDFTLNGIALTEKVNSLSCKIVTIGGQAVTPVDLPVDTATTVPGSGTFDGDLIPGEWVNVGVRCTGSAVNVTNSITASGTAPNGFVAKASDDNDPKNECPPPAPMVTIDKDCPAETDVHLVKKDGVLAVEVCPTIKVKNTSDGEVMSSVLVTDTLLGMTNVEIGPLDPQEEKVIDDKCYFPSAPEQGAIDGAGGVQFKPTGSSFFNTAKVTAQGALTGKVTEAQDSAGKGECDLCVCDGEACE